jgi:hypothetical protein
MADVLLFKPKSERDAEANLCDLIAFAKNELTTFGADLDFESDDWDVTAHANLKGRNTRLCLRFTDFPSSRGMKDGTPMPEPFKSFAKAYLRNFHALSQANVDSHLIAALRALAQALQENFPVPTPTLATLHHFRRASQILVERYKHPDAPNIRLERISEFLAKNGLVVTPIVWRKPTSRVLPTTSRVGPEFDARRNARLPSPEALSAIAEIFHVAKDPSDIFVTSACAILSSAPSRANEMLHLPENCEVHATDSEGQAVYGLRWRPSKGGEAMVKWVVHSMASVAQEAVANLRKLSEEARSVALWYEKNPNKLFLPKHLEHFRSKPRLTYEEVGEIVFRDTTSNRPKQAGTKWCETYNIESSWDANGRYKTVAFSDVERAVLALLPLEFPIANEETGLHYSDALCLVLRNELSSCHATYRGVVVLADYSVMQSRLVGTKTVQTVFEKFGYKDANGTPLRLTTHQFRHYLNTLAQMGGLSQLDIAKWSGRAKVAQNAVYDHQSDRDVLAMVRAAIGDGAKMFGPLAHTPKNTLITRDQFSTLKVLTAHTTDFGYCIHDFSMLPCQIHRDCLNCDEHVCVKGDQVRERAIRLHRSETTALLATAKEALAEDEFGANRWVEHQSLTLQRLSQLCTLLDDPSVPDGAIIQPAGVTSASRLEQARQQVEQTRPRIASPDSTESQS